jgi:hypothetical protein
LQNPCNKPIFSQFLQKFGAILRDLLYIFTHRRQKMNLPPPRFLLTLVSLLVFALAACSAPAAEAPTEPPAPPTATATITPSPEPTFTSTPRPTRTATPTQTPLPMFFTEEMDSSTLVNWQRYIYGDQQKNTYRMANGELLFNITERDAGIDFTYMPYTYTDVRIDARFENKPESRNTINVSLLCRASDKGFYQVLITNDGRYVFGLYNADTQQNRNIGNGGSFLINQGKAVNEYGLVCKGNELTLFVNGEEVRTVTDQNNTLTEGYVQIYVGAIQDLVPVVVGVDWVKISQP